MLNGNLNKTYLNHYKKVLVSLICKELNKINEEKIATPINSMRRKTEEQNKNNPLCFIWGSFLTEYHKSAQ